MTEDHDVLEGRQPPSFSARANVTFHKPAGRVLGCVLEQGTVTRGMPVTVLGPEGVEHHGVVVSLRHQWDDADAISTGEFGMLLEPPYWGPVPAQVEGGREAVAVT